jgi:dihydroorotate dehydrogenase
MEGSAMKIRGIDFGNVWAGSGSMGFFGGGYWFHKFWRWKRLKWLSWMGIDPLDLSDVCFVSTTATIDPVEGNMPLADDFEPKEWFPRCIKTKWRKAAMLNSKRFSNPGLPALLDSGRWQERKRPFWISLGSISEKPADRLRDFERMARALEPYRKQFKAPFGLQPNPSCINTGHDLRALMAESFQMLDILGSLGVPLVPKYSIEGTSARGVLQLQDSPHCDGICVSNTVSYKYAGLGKKIWGREVSPLAHLGGGAISGPELCPMVCSWICQAREIGFAKYINGGGGVFDRDAVVRFWDADANSVYIASVIPMRPWRVKSIIDQANALPWD